MDRYISELLHGDEEQAQALEAYLGEHYAPKELVRSLSAEKAALETALDELRRTDAVREGLRERGVSDPDYVIYRKKGINGFSFDEKGLPEGLDEVVKELAGTPAGSVLLPQKRAYVPGRGESASANPFAPESFDLTEQGRLMRSSPELARQLAAAAK